MVEVHACISMQRTSHEGGCSSAPLQRSSARTRCVLCVLATHITVLGLAKGGGGARGWRHGATAALVVVAGVEPGGEPHCLCLLALLADARKPERVGRKLRGALTECNTAGRQGGAGRRLAAQQARLTSRWASGRGGAQAQRQRQRGCSWAARRHRSSQGCRQCGSWEARPWPAGDPGVREAMVTIKSADSPNRRARRVAAASGLPCGPPVGR